MRRKLILKVFLFAVAAFLFAAIAFSAYTILDAPLNKLSLVDKSALTKNSLSSELEELTTVRRSDLQNYLLFSDYQQRDTGFIEKQIEEGNIDEVSEGLLIKMNIQLPELLVNECERIFCFQSRLEFSKIPSLFWRGLIGVEDSRFLDHQGIDFKSILRAVIVDLKEMSLVQGGSTITQQLVKNLYFTNEKKLIRKLKELVLAVYIEGKYEKEQILEAYFNEIYWGVKQGVYVKGIYAAALFYFAKSPELLTEYEVSILISLLKGPNYYNPLNKVDRLKERTRYVFKRLKDLNFISDKIEPWNNLDWNRWIKDLENREEKRPHQGIYYISKFEAPIFSDFEKFILMSNVYKSLNQRNKDSDVQLAVKASFYDFRDKKKFSFYSNPYRNMEDAISSERHQVGSILKPIIYSFYVAEGKKLDDQVETAPIPLNLKSGTWSPKEAHEIASQEITLREALQLSYNRPVIRIANELGFEKIESHLIQYIPEIKKPLGEYPAQLLGAVELSVEEVLSVYTKFISAQCSMISEEFKLEDTVMFSMSDPTMTTIRRQVGEDLGNLKFFGKTGTSNNGNDNWFIGFDGRLLSVFWFGNEGEKSQTNLGLYGSTTSFRIFRNFLNQRGKQVGDIGCHYLD